MQHFSNISLKPYNTFAIDTMAKDLYTFSSEKELVELLEIHANEPVFILGGGSNILFTRPLDVLVLKNEILGIDIIDETDHDILVQAGAGEQWHDLVTWAVDQGYGGIENMALIPGTVGAAPMQNIGAYGVELKDVFVGLAAVQLDHPAVHQFDAVKCRFDYRYSIFKGPLKNKYCITTVTLKLQKQSQLNTSYGAILTELNKRRITNPTIRDVYDTVIEIRRSKLPDPAKIGNGGSFFKNPIVSKHKLQELLIDHPKVPHYLVNAEEVKIPAGWLIEQMGWKGHREGDVGVFPNHALVLVNWGGGSGQDIWNLARKIQQSVEEEFGIHLEPEVNIM